MRKTMGAAAVAVVLCLVGVAAQKRVSVTVFNDSHWEIHELYLSPVDDEEWGPDQLQAETIPSKASFVLKGVPIGEYDVKIVDEDGDECIVEAVEIGTEGHEKWRITSKDLVRCVG